MIYWEDGKNMAKFNWSMDLMEIHLLFSQLKKIYEEIITAHNFNSLYYFDDGVPKPSLNIVKL